MIHLFYSNHLEALLHPLAQRLDAADPFTIKRIAVPNPNLKTWLNLELAAQRGVAVNLEYVSLNQALTRSMAGNAADLVPENVIQMMIFRLIEGYAKERDPELSMLGYYLSGPGDRTTRIFQLSRKLAGLFREYGFSREEMVHAWMGGRSWFDGANRMELWQRRLWNDLFGPGGLIQSRNALPNRRPLLTLPLIHYLYPPQNGVFEDAPLHLFGISYISRFHQRLLKELSPHLDINLYILNPCMAFWEDLKTRKEARAIQSHMSHSFDPDLIEQEDLSALADENPFLQAWGRPGREYMRLLNEAAGWDVEDAFVMPEHEPNLLHELQSGILYRTPPPDAPTLPEGDDPSLTVIAAPSPRREAEIIANTVWDLLIDDPALSLRDIAVIAADMRTYQSELESAFQSIGGIPYNLVDGVTGRASRLIEAVNLLLDLPGGRFTRETVFTLYRYPNFQARFPEIDPETWLRYADDLSIFYGRDRRDIRTRGISYFEDDLYSWDQGFKRLLLGSYIHDQEVYRAGDDAYAVYPLDESGAEDAARFYTITQSLFRDTTTMARLRLSAKRWAAWLRDMMDTYLAPLPAEEGDFEKLRRLAGGIAVLGEAYDDPDTPIPFDLIKAFFKQELQTLEPYFGNYLADGVTISSFRPMRPIPFRIIFVCGLDETRFPSPGRKDTLDLRNAARTITWPDGNVTRETRMIGDVNDQEKERYMFLETLISARDRLVLSYTARNEHTDDLINPSAVLAELLTRLPQYKAFFKPVEHPLKSYAPDYRFFPKPLDMGPQLRSYDPFAQKLALARQLRAAAEANGGVQAEALRILGIEKERPPTDDASFPAARFNLYQIRNFLENPLQASAKRTLRLRERREDSAERIHEPFTAAANVKRTLLDEVTAELLSDRQAAILTQDIPQRLNRITARETLRGKMPSGPLYQVARDAMVSAVTTWMEHLNQINVPGPGERYRLGRDADEAASRFFLHPIRMTLPHAGEDLHVEISGKTEYIFEHDGAAASVFFHSSANNQKSAIRFLRGFMDAVALAGHFKDVQAYVIGPGKSQQMQTTVTQQEAAAWLRHMVEDMLSGPHDYLLPLDVALKLRDVPAERLQERYEAELRNTIRSDRPGYAAYGPVDDWRDYPPHPDVAEVLERRYGLLFRGLASAKEVGK